MPLYLYNVVVEAMLKIVAIGIGGALGAITRHLINISPIAGAFARLPLPTFLINIAGSFLIGFFAVYFADRVEINKAISMGVIVGFLGAFTTFSAFEIETYSLVKDREFISAGVYVMLSVLLGLLGVAAGVELAKRM